MTSPKRKLRTSDLIVLCVLAVVVLCGIGGVATLNAIVGDPEPKTTAAAGGAPQQVADIPTTPDPTVEAFAPTVEPSPIAAPTTTKAKAKPTVTHKAVPKPKPTTKKPRPKPTRTSSGHKVVHPGAFCSPEGAHGVTSKGTLMRCTKKSGEDRARWRKA